MSSVAQTQALIKTAQNSGEDNINSTIDIELWYDVEDKEKATERVDLSIVNKLTFDENMFSVLPTMTLEMVDDGTYYNLKPMKIGRKIYVRIQSSAKTQDNKEVTPILTRMTIDSITQKVNQGTGTSNMLVHCVYDCQGFINKVPTYPIPGLVTLPIPENSNDAVTKVCNAVGLSCDGEYPEGLDVMNYVNETLTAKKLVDKIVDHAWVGENDAPVFYVDLEGTAHFTTISKMVHTSNKLNCIGQVLFNRQFQRIEHEEFYNTFLVPGQKLIYQDLKQVNLGAKVNNIGGGIVKAAVYDPIGLTNIALKLTDKNTQPDINNIGTSEKPNTNYNCYKGSADTTWLGNTSNREAAECNKVRATRQFGIASSNVHNWYEAASANNYTVKMAFFQNFWKLTLDVNKQPRYFYQNASLMPRIGMKINIDFTDEDYDNKIYNGDYLITRVQHIWTRGNSYAIAITVVADGYYDSKPKCKYYDKCPNKANCARSKDFSSCEFYKQLKVANK